MEAPVVEPLERRLVEVHLAFHHEGTATDRRTYLKSPRGALVVSWKGLAFVSLGKHAHKLRNLWQVPVEHIAFDLFGAFLGGSLRNRIERSSRVEANRRRRAEQALASPYSFTRAWSEIADADYAATFKGTPDGGLSITFDPLQLRLTDGREEVLFVARRYRGEAPEVSLENIRRNDGRGAPMLEGLEPLLEAHDSKL